MSRRPVVGIPTQNLQSIGGVPENLPASWVMSHRYILTLTGVGAVPWMIPLVHEDDETLRAIYEELDGVFLPGGADIDPAAYKEERHPTCDRSDPPRDAVEVALTRWATQDRKPVLGVCRGLQLINLAGGGTLYQDLADQRPGSIKHDYFPFRDGFSRDHLAHEVEVTPNTRLARAAGETRFKVNSMHHQGVRDLGEGLVVSAVAPDGVIEGLESPAEDHFLVGVQWHPEVLSDGDPKMRKLFEEFVAEAAAYREQRLAGLAIR